MVEGLRLRDSSKTLWKCISCDDMDVGDVERHLHLQYKAAKNHRAYRDTIAQFIEEFKSRLLQRG